MQREQDMLTYELGWPAAAGQAYLYPSCPLRFSTLKRQELGKRRGRRGGDVEGDGERGRERKKKKKCEPPLKIIPRQEKKIVFEVVWRRDSQGLVELAAPLEEGHVVPGGIAAWRRPGGGLANGLWPL